MVLAWCIGLQVLVLGLAMAGRLWHAPAGQTSAAAWSPAAEVFVPVTGSAGGGPARPEDTGGTRQAPVLPAGLTDLPDPVADLGAAADPPPAPLPPDAITGLLSAPVDNPANHQQPPARPARLPGDAPNPGAAVRQPTRASGGDGSVMVDGPRPCRATVFTGAGTGRFPLPPYPAEAKRRGLEGTVTVLVEVAADGSPGTPVIVSGSGTPLLDRAAAGWIKRRWRWDPGASRLYQIPITFRLE